MTAAQGDDRLNRLEYFIQLAKTGKKVRVEITLRKELLEQRVHPDETDDVTGMTHMYLLLGDYLCECEGEISTISKIYVYGKAEESVSTGRVNQGVANARLKMDYQRLKDAKIKFEEKYF
jgi:hypothetical protein